MQAQNDEVLIKIRVSEEEVEAKIVKIRQELTALKAEEKALQKAYNENAVESKKYEAAMEGIVRKRAALNASLKEERTELTSLKNAEAEAQASLAKLREGMSSLNKAYEGANQTLEDTVEITQTVEERVKSLAAEFQASADATSEAGSSIDNLDDKIAQLTKEYNALTAEQRASREVGGVLLGSINNLTRQQEKNAEVVEKSKKGLKEYARDVNVLGFNVGETIDSFKNAYQASLSFAKGILTGRGALIALGAVPILAVLGALFTFLTKSQKGMDLLAKATSVVTAVISALTNKVAAVGEAIFNAFENPKKGLQDLANFLQNNLQNRFAAIGLIIDAIRSKDFGKLADATVQLATGAKNGYTRLKEVAQAGIDVANTVRMIEEAEVALNVERGKSQVLIERNKKLAEDSTKSGATRAAAAKAAAAAEVSLLNGELALQRQRIKLEQQKYNAGEKTRAQQNKIAEERGKLGELEADSLGRQTELQNQLNTINAETAAKAKEDRAKAAKELVDAAETALIVAKRNGEDTIALEEELLKKRIKFIKAKRDADIDAIEKGTGADQAAAKVRAQADTDIQEATLETAQKVAEITLKAKMSEIETSLALARKGSEEELELKVKQLNAIRNRDEANARATIKNEGKLRDELIRIDANLQRATGELRAQYAEADIQRDKELADARLQTTFDLGSRSLEAERKLAADRIDLEEKTQLAIIDLQLLYAQITEDQAKTSRDKITAEAKKQRQEQSKAINAIDLDNEKALNDAKLIIARDGSKQQYKLLIDNLEIERKKRIAAAKEDADAIKAINEDINNQEIKLAKEREKTLKEKIIEVANFTVSAASSIVEAQSTVALNRLNQQQEAALASAALTAEQREKLEAKFQKQRDEIEQKNNQRRKRVALAQNIINGAIAATKAFAELGPIAGAIAVALIATQVAAAAVTIDNTKYARGGVHRSDGRGSYVQGPGTGKSDSINARISNGESIINAESTRKHYRTLSAINVDGGGRAFPGITANRYLLNAQHATPQFAYGGVQITTDAQAIAAAVIKGMSGVTIVTDIQAVTAAQKDLIKTQARGDI